MSTVPKPETESPSSERRNLVDALAHERNVLRTMIDLIPATIFAKDAQSRFTAANKLVAARLGFSKETMSRLLRRFTDQGLIEPARGKIRILDRERLGAVARNGD